MLSAFVKEQKRYSKNELKKVLCLKSDEFTSFVRKLKSVGVLKMVKATPEERLLSDLLGENAELVNEDEDTDKYYYVFTYVGILTIGNRVLKCYPKYINETDPHEKMKQILKVLRKYNSREQIVSLYNGEEENTSFNLLAIMLYLLEEYSDNGVYSNQLITAENNGTGEILWDNTISETYAVINNGRPIYVDLKTINIDEDRYDYFRRLHCCIVTQCSKILEEAGLDKLFDLVLVDVSEAEIEDFGDDEYILYRIQRELDIQFNDRKKMLLKTIYTYISRRKAFETGLGISMFGTNSFNLVWEKVCADVFDNKLNVSIKELKDIPNSDYFTSETKTLIEVIEKPKWRYKYSNTCVEQSKTLKPDLISIYAYKESFCFAILDAKYYMIQLTPGSIAGNPGVGDITKQYLYQLAYQEFIEKGGFKYLQNAFLMPVDDEKPEFVGTAEFDMMNFADKKLVNISVIKLPARKLYQAYISGKTNVELYEYLKIAPVSKIQENSFTNRMLAYLNSYRTMKKNNAADKITSYPEQIRNNIGAKVLFDFIIPEVESHMYVYSSYNNEFLNVTEKAHDNEMKERIVQLIQKIISCYIEEIQGTSISFEGRVEWLETIIDEYRITEIGGLEHELVKLLDVLYE